MWYIVCGVGNAELERRRAELRDQQRKEEEARLAKERAEQEKRDAIKYVYCSLIVVITLNSKIYGKHLLWL